MKNKLISFLKKEQVYEYFLQKLAKRNKTLEQHIANLNPISWVDSAFLWSKNEIEKWSKIDKKWKEIVTKK